MEAVAGFVFGANGHCEEGAGLRKVLPGVFGDVAERSVAASGELAQEQSGSGRSVISVRGIHGIFFVRVFFLGRSAAHGEPSTVRAEGEGFDAIDGGKFAGGEIEEADFLGNELFVFF